MENNSAYARDARRETLNTLSEISRILDTGLDKESLAICVTLCESGVNPEALAAVIRELRREASSLKAAASSE